MTTCKACGGSIRWQRRGAKWWALDPDGGNHWAHCLGRRKKTTGPLEIVGQTIRGADYLESCGGCALPPWEECGCSFPESSAAELLNREADERLQLALSE